MKEYQHLAYLIKSVPIKVAEVWKYMISSHGNNMSAVVTGSSVHNERIERLWRDVHHSVVSSNSAVFRNMESEGILDPLNAVDLYRISSSNSENK